MAEKALPLPHRVGVAKAAAASRCRRCRRCKGSSKGVQIGRDRGCKSRRNAGFRAKGRGFEPHLPPARGLQSVPLARTQGKAAEMRKWWQSKRPTSWRAPALRRHGPGGPTPLQSLYSRPTRRADESRDRAPYRHSWSRTAPRQRRKSYLSPPNGFIVALSLNSAGGSISKARRFPSCCS